MFQQSCAQIVTAGPDHSHHSSGDSSHSRDSEHDHAHDHDHDHGHESEHAHQDTTSGHTSPAATAFAHSSVVIDVPADGSASDSHKQPRGGHCTIKKAGSREIEIQYELPVSALPAAKAPGHTHAHDHDHGGHNHGCHSHGSINLRSAVLHVIGDLLQSIGVAIAGGLIWLNQDDPRWHLADPICTFVFSIVVLLTTKSVLKDIINVLMERTPRHINIPAMSQVSFIRSPVYTLMAPCATMHQGSQPVYVPLQDTIRLAQCSDQWVAGRQAVLSNPCVHSCRDQ